MTKNSIKKVVLAYSGGLDTSVILKWLQEEYDCEVVTFTADIGQGEEIGPVREKAKMLGIKNIFVEDLKEEFVRDYVFPMFRANPLYEGQYLLGTSIDLNDEKIIYGNNEIKFKVDSFKKKCLLEGLDDIALSLKKSDKIEYFEKNLKNQKPWIIND